MLDIIYNQTFQHLAIIFALFLTAWGYSVRGKFVSDDIEGIARFSNYWDDKNQKVVDTYVHDKELFKHRQFNPKIGFPGSVIRWLRLNIGARFMVIGKDKKGKEQYGYMQWPFKHHLINLVLHSINLVLAYLLLSHLFGPDIAFVATLLFSVHPVTAQAVAWCSGIGYLHSLVWILATLLVCTLVASPYVTIPFTIIATLIAASSLLVGAFTWAPLLVLGHYPEAIICFVISVVILARQGMEVIGYRKNEFKKQNMGRSTFLNFRKPIVALKTLWYYTKLLIVPKSLGLFHTWGYHYKETTERINKQTLLGMGVLASMVFFCLMFPSNLLIRFAFVWMLFYLIPFLNFITAQQFVADRYTFIPCLGFCLLLAFLLQPFPLLAAFIIGGYLVRVLVHLPTFHDEIAFYQSNIWNFPNSEVAYGNLGVSCAKVGMTGWAFDTWRIATRINPRYDVPHYNLFSFFRSNGDLVNAKKELEACLDADVVHFNERWQKEYDDLCKAMKEQDEKKKEQERQATANQLRNPLPGQAGPPTPGVGQLNQPPGLPR